MKRFHNPSECFVSIDQESPPPTHSDSIRTTPPFGPEDRRGSVRSSSTASIKGVERSGSTSAGHAGHERFHAWFKQAPVGIGIGPKKTDSRARIDSISQVG